MWEAFSNDESGFKKKIYIFCIITLLSFVSAYTLNAMRVTQAAENNKLAATYQSQSTWLRQIDYEEMDALYVAILKPVKAAEIDSVQEQQLDILRNHNLVIESVRNDNDKKLKKNAKIKSVLTQVTVQGSWDNIVAALNEFETKNLVVITELDMSPDKKSGVVEAKMKYNIYYQ